MADIPTLIEQKTGNLLLDHPIQTDKYLRIEFSALGL